MTKPIGPQEIARLAAGEVDDPGEVRRIFEAMQADPGLGELYDILADKDDLKVNPAWKETPEDKGFSERLTLHRHSRLWTLGKNPFPDLLQYGKTESVSVTSPGTTGECRFFKSAGSAPLRFELEFGLPAGCTLLDVVCLKLPSPQHTTPITTRKVHGAWNAPANVRAYGMAAAGMQLAAHAAVPVVVEQDGTDVSLDVDGCRPHEVYLRAKKRTSHPSPLPVLLTGLDRHGQSETELVLVRADRPVYPVFAGRATEFTQLHARLLVPQDVPSLSADQASQLLGESEFHLAAVDELKPGRYAFEFMADSHLAFACDPHVAISLKVSDTGKGVA